MLKSEQTQGKPGKNRSMAIVLTLVLLFAISLFALPVFADVTIYFDTNGNARNYGPGATLLALGRIMDSGLPVPDADLIFDVKLGSEMVFTAAIKSDSAGFFGTSFNLPRTAQQGETVTFTVTYGQVLSKSITTPVRAEDSTSLNGFSFPGYLDRSAIAQTVDPSIGELALSFGGNVNYFNAARGGDMIQFVSFLGLNTKNADSIRLYEDASDRPVGITVQLITPEQDGPFNYYDKDTLAAKSTTRRDTLRFTIAEKLRSGTVYRIEVSEEVSVNSSASLGHNEVIYFRTAGAGGEEQDDGVGAPGAAPGATTGTAGPAPNVAQGSVTQAKSASGKATVSAQAGALGELGATGVVVVTITEKPADAAVLDKLAGLDAANKLLAGTIYTVATTNDGKSTGDAYQQYRVDIDVSDAKLTDAQKEKLSGIFFDPATGTYKSLGGELSADGKTFTFYASKAGDYAVAVSPGLMKVNFVVGSGSFTLNGQTQQSDMAPVIEGDRTLMPLRALGEALGAGVLWDDATRTVTVTKDGKSVSVVIGEELPGGMGTAVIMSGRTMLPIRYVAQMLDCNILWDSTDSSIKVYS